MSGGSILLVNKILFLGYPKFCMVNVSLMIALLLATSVVCGCRNDGNESSNIERANKQALPRVLTTTGMIADMVKRIGGDAVLVESLMGPGIDPHLYKTTEGDIRRLSGAELIFYNGLKLEGKMADILEHVGRNRPVIAVSSGVAKERLRSPKQFEGHPDPHIWFDVDLWRGVIGPIATHLARLLKDDALKVKIQHNAERLDEELVQLDAWVKAQIATIAGTQRVLVTAHDAFGYFGKRYGMEVVGLQGISTVSQAGIRDVERVVELVTTRKIKAIFVESSVPKRNLEAVQEACRKRGHDVRIGGQLYSDSMGPSGTDEGTYIGMVKKNVTVITGALR